MAAITDYASLYPVQPAPIGETARVMESFAPAATVSGKDLAQTASDNLSMYLSFVGMDTDGYTFLVHRLAKVLFRPGGTGQALEGSYLATLQDVQEYAMNTVVVPIEWFEQIQTPVLPLTETIEAAAGNNPRSSIMGPYQPGDPGTTDTQEVRPLCYVPPQYTNLLISRCMTAWEFWDDVVGAITAAGQTQAYNKLVRWGRAALTSGDDPTNSVVAVCPPTPSTLDPPVHRLRLGFLKADLPARFPAPTPSNPVAMASTTAALNGLRLDLQWRAEKDEEDRKAKKEPSGRWKVSIDELYKFC